MSNNEDAGYAMWKIGTMDDKAKDENESSVPFVSLAGLVAKKDDNINYTDARVNLYCKPAVDVSTILPFGAYIISQKNLKELKEDKS